MSVMGEPIDVSLKEKLRAHWRTRDTAFKPKPEIANKFGVAYTWIFSTSLLYTALSITLPHLHQISDTQQTGSIKIAWFHMPSCIATFLVWFMYVELLLNWGLCALKEMSRVTLSRYKKAVGVSKSEEHRYSSGSSSGSGTQGTEGLADGVEVCQRRGGLSEDEVDQMAVRLKGFQTCPTCQIFVPPRSHHCTVCNMCILKHDHHCYFTASCIGYYNQRYFIVFLFYATVGSACSAFITLCSLCEQFSHDSLADLARYASPYTLALWIYGSLETGHFLIILQLNFTLMTLCIAVAFFVWQSSIILRSQTTYEASCGIYRYCIHGFTQNLRAVFGFYWPLNFLFPLRTLPVGEGEGFFWESQKLCKGN